MAGSRPFGPRGETPEFRLPPRRRQSLVHGAVAEGRLAMERSYLDNFAPLGVAAAVSGAERTQHRVIPLTGRRVREQHRDRLPDAPAARHRTGLHLGDGRPRPQELDRRLPRRPAARQRQQLARLGIRARRVRADHPRHLRPERWAVHRVSAGQGRLRRPRQDGAVQLHGRPRRQLRQADDARPARGRQGLLPLDDGHTRPEELDRGVRRRPAAGSRLLPRLGVHPGRHR